MKIRLKFSKQGRIKFVGHLDLLRLFERVIKRTNLPVAYSQGFNPHSLLYFAQALSVGITSEGEYLDIHLTEEVDPELVKKQLNDILPEGLKITNVNILLEESKICMALIDSSSYTIWIDKTLDNKDLIEQARAYYDQEENMVTRISKKKARLINIKEFIYKLEMEEDDSHYIIYTTLAAGSRKNLNAKLFIEAFIEHSQLDLNYRIHRNELFSLQGEDYLPLWKTGV